MIKNFIFFITCLFAVSCNGKKDNGNLVERVKFFDNHYSQTIQSLYDSLTLKVGNDFDYIVEFRQKSIDTYFSKLDSNGVDLGYFEPNFKLNKKQIDFLQRGIVGNIFFSKNKQIFSMKLFYFKDYDTAIRLHITSPKEETVIPFTNDSVLYKQINRYYTLVNAW